MPANRNSRRYRPEPAVGGEGFFRLIEASNAQQQYTEQQVATAPSVGDIPGACTALNPRFGRRGTDQSTEGQAVLPRQNTRD